MRVVLFLFFRQIVEGGNYTRRMSLFSNIDDLSREGTILEGGTILETLRYNYLKLYSEDFFRFFELKVVGKHYNRKVCLFSIFADLRMGGTVLENLRNTAYY